MGEGEGGDQCAAGGIFESAGPRAALRTEKAAGRNHLASALVRRSYPPLLCKNDQGTAAFVLCGCESQAGGYWSQALELPVFVRNERLSGTSDTGPTPALRVWWWTSVPYLFVYSALVIVFRPSPGVLAHILFPFLIAFWLSL